MACYAWAMRLTKYTHSCVRLESGDSALVVDPGIWAEPAALAGADAVLITHQHPDHFDPAALAVAADANPALRIWTHQAVAAQLSDLAERVTVVESGAVFHAAGFPVRAYGGQHALIHPDIPMIANLGFLIDETVYHPGDSFTVPPAPVATLLVPTHAPWMRMAEAIDFVRAVRPARAYSIHDGLLNDRAIPLVDRHLRTLTEPFGVDYGRIETATSVAI